MHLKLQIILSIIIILYGSFVCADDTVRKRPHHFTFRVVGWELKTFEAHSQKKFQLHRHEHIRILVAFANGKLKVIKNKGKPEILHVEKDKMYYLERNKVGELHALQNMSNYPIKILIMEIF